MCALFETSYGELTFDAEGPPVGGPVTATAGDVAVTGTFVDDVGAPCQVEGGATGALSRADNEAATEGR